MIKGNPENKCFHRPLEFILPPSLSEFGEMVDSLQASFKSRAYNWACSFYGIDFGYFTGYMYVNFTLVDENRPAANSAFYPIDIRIIDGRIYVEYPPKWYKEEEVKSIIEVFTACIDKVQQKVKAARHV